MLTEQCYQILMLLNIDDTKLLHLYSDFHVCLEFIEDFLIHC